MQRIQKLDSASTECANNVLSWVLFAQRLMTIEGLRCALAVEPDDSFLDEEAPPDCNYLLSVCCGLIMTSGVNDIVWFVHYTTQEYFERPRHPLLSAAQASRTYLSQLFLQSLFLTLKTSPKHSKCLVNLRIVSLCAYGNTFFSIMQRNIGEAMLVRLITRSCDQRNRYKIRCQED